jgi:putative nucleotidyltransferase with HDIG domain
MVLGIYAGRDFTVFVQGALVGWVGILMSRQMRSRYQIYFVSGAVLVVGFLISLIMALFKHGEVISGLDLLEANFLTAIASGLLVLGVLPVFERVFRVSTDFLLLELSNLNNHILLELSQKAPGTFTHSILLGNLSEAAARAIGANPLLARVGAYYHDIGKAKRPEYFIENQRGKVNPHEKLSPKMSVLILSSHIKEGVELARSHGLPNEIIEIIASHHGTSLMKFFYNKAKEQGMDAQVDEFRYPGPKPRSKEAAILMIVDAAEATARSQGNITSSRMKAIVRETIEDRLADGQFDETDLTRRDLLAIGDAIYPILVGVFHPRIEYPKEKNREDHQRTGKDAPQEGDEGDAPKAH